MMLFSVLAVGLSVCLALLSWRRSGWRWKFGLVEGLRVLLISLAVLLLWQPETVYQTPPERQEKLVVLVDHSASMETRDVTIESELSTRKGIADEIANDAVWNRLGDRFNRIQLNFAGRPDQPSDLAAAIERIEQTEDSPSAIIVLSDGAVTAHDSPIQAAADYATASGGRSRIFTVPIGQTNRLPDVELMSVDVPTFGVKAKPVRIPYSIRNWFTQTRELTLALKVNDETVEQQTVTVAGGAIHGGVFTWQSDDVGQFAIAVESPVLDSEANRENNRVVRSIEIRQEQLRVLIVESTPRWEFRYLRNALLRDPGIDVSCLLFQPAINSVGGGGKDYLADFPDDAATLASYDVIFLGDVGTDAGQLTIEQCRQIQGLVVEQAVGLVLMPGMRGEHRSLLSSELGELYPVLLESTNPLGIGSETPGSFSLTDRGRRSLLTELIPDRQQNWSIWQSLPGFYWHAGVTRAKAGSEVLAVHEEASNQYGRIPLLVTRTAGAGKVLFMGTDSAWRWRMGVEDKYHYRFWGQVIRWMAYQRNMAVGETMRLSYRPEQPRQGETVSLRASVMTSGGTPWAEDNVTIDVIDPRGDRQRLRMRHEESEWGVYWSQLQMNQPGQYQLSLKHPTEDSVLAAKIEVQGRGAEQVGQPARPDILREVARVGGGEAMFPDQLDELISSLLALPPDPSQTRRIQWWNHPAIMFAMIVGLGLFWVGRKWVGTV